MGILAVSGVRDSGRHMPEAEWECPQRGRSGICTMEILAVSGGRDSGCHILEAEWESVLNVAEAECFKPVLAFLCVMHSLLTATGHQSP